VLKTVKDACELHPMALSYTAKDQIENLLDLINQEGDGTAFFQKNFVTSGMANLFQMGADLESFLRELGLEVTQTEVEQ